MLCLALSDGVMDGGVGNGLASGPPLSICSAPMIGSLGFGLLKIDGLLRVFMLGVWCDSSTPSVR